MTITDLTKSQVALLDHIDAKREAEYKHSYDITHLERTDAYYAWLHAKRKGFDFNTYLWFSFDFDPKNPYDNALKIRAVAHHLLAYLHRNGKIPSHTIWTRSVPVGTCTEVCQLITHIPPKLADDFRRYACKWEGLNIRIDHVTYDKEWEVEGGRLVTIFDLMFAATSANTRSKIRNVYTLDSGICYRPRVFCSQKLNKDDITRETFAMSAIKSSEALQASLDKNGGIV